MENLGDLFGDVFKSVMKLTFIVIIEGSKHEWNLTELSQYCLINNQVIENITINKKS